MKYVSITPLPLAKRELIARHRAEKKAARGRKRLRNVFRKSEHDRAHVGIPNIRELEPLEFARALLYFRDYLEVLAVEDREIFRVALYRYLTGRLLPQYWHEIVLGLRAAISASTAQHSSFTTRAL